MRLGALCIHAAKIPCQLSADTLLDYRRRQLAPIVTEGVNYVASSIGSLPLARYADNTCR